MRKYHKHQVTPTDGSYYHLISQNHRTEFGRIEHEKELQRYEKEMSLWRSAREKIKKLGGSVRKYRERIFIGGVPTLIGLLLIISLIPGVQVSGVRDYYCGSVCEIPIQICTSKYDLVFREDAHPLYFDKNVTYYILKDGELFNFSNQVLRVGECWNLTIIVNKDEKTTVKYGVKFGDFEKDPLLISRIRRKTFEDIDLLNGRRRMIIYSGTRFVERGKRWIPIERARSLKSDFKIVYLERDPRWNVEVLDFNYTWIRFRILSYNSICLLYTSPSPRDLSTSRMPSSA